MGTKRETFAEGGISNLVSNIKAWVSANFASKDAATQSEDGLMSSTDKTKLDGVATGATANTGTVTSVGTGVGLTGGPVTSSGTVKANLRSETALTNNSVAATEAYGRVYPIAVDNSGYLAVNVPWYNYTVMNNGGLMANTIHQSGQPVRVEFGLSSDTMHLMEKGLGSWVGACTTNANVRTKAVTGASGEFNGFSLANGARVKVTFQYENTYSSDSIILQVAGTTPCPVKVGGTVTGSTNQLTWSRGAEITFVFYDNYWHIAEEPSSYMTECSSSGSSLVKTVGFSDKIVLRKGTRFVIWMHLRNTVGSASSKVTLAIDGTNIMFQMYQNDFDPIVANNSWYDESVVTFIFNGSKFVRECSKMTWGEICQ